MFISPLVSLARILHACCHKTLSRLVVAGLLTIFLGAARAEGVADLYDVKTVRVGRDGISYVEFTQNLTGTPPSCDTTDNANKLAFDVNEAGGRAVLAIVLAADTSGKKIKAKGSSVGCATVSTIEDWGWGYIN